MELLSPWNFQSNLSFTVRNKSRPPAQVYANEAVLGRGGLVAIGTNEQPEGWKFQPHHQPHPHKSGERERAGDQTQSPMAKDLISHAYIMNLHKTPK